MASTDIRILDQRTPQERDRPFLPGAGKTWLLPFYDALTRLAGIRALHERAVELAGIEPGQTVADIGCGTGNLSFAVLAAEPGARVTGLDPDGAALRRAARKARRRRVALTLVQGYADRIPADDATLDHIVSSLALHHLDDDSRIAFAREARRALRPGGRITIVDLGGPSNNAEHASHAHGPLHALRHLLRVFRPRVANNPALTSNNDDAISKLLSDAGFADAREVAHTDHSFGRITFVQATHRRRSRD